jgi:hypothetical protein
MGPLPEFLRPVNRPQHSDHGYEIAEVDIHVALPRRRCLQSVARSSSGLFREEEANRRVRIRLRDLLDGRCEVAADERVVLNDQEMRRIREVFQAALVSRPRRRRIALVNHDLRRETQRIRKFCVEVTSSRVGLDAGNYLHRAG